MSLTRTTNSLNIVGLLPTDDIYYYKSYGSGYFGAQFKHEFDFIVTDKSVESVCTLWMVSNTGNGYYAHETNKYDCLNLRVEDNLLILSEIVSGVINSSNTVIAENTKYYVRIRRYKNSLSCYLYNDEARINLVDYIHLSLYSSNSSFRFLYAMSSYYSKTVTTDSFSGVISNLALKSIIPLSVIMGMNSSPTPALSIETALPRANRRFGGNIEEELSIDSTILRVNKNLSSSLSNRLTVEGAFEEYSELVSSLSLLLSLQGNLQSVTGLSSTVSNILSLDGNIKRERGFTSDIETYLNVNAVTSAYKRFTSEISNPHLSFLRNPTLNTQDVTLIRSAVRFILDIQNSIRVNKRLSSDLTSALLINGSTSVEKELFSSVNGVLNVDSPILRRTRDFSSIISDPKLSFYNPELLTSLSQYLSSNILLDLQTTSGIRVNKRFTSDLSTELAVSNAIKVVRGLVSQLNPELLVSGSMYQTLVSIFGSSSLSLSTDSQLRVAKRLISEIVGDLEFSGWLGTTPPVEIISLLSIITTLLSKNSNITTLVSKNSYID